LAGASHWYAVTTLPVFLIEFFTVPELAELAIRRYFLFRIRRFINLTHEHALASGLHPNCFGRAKDYAVDESIAQAGLDAFAEAMELSENDAIRARVEKASICAYRAAIESITGSPAPTPVPSSMTVTGNTQRWPAIASSISS
jgi:hypothetical protein